MLGDLNSLYRNERALHLYDEKREGFEWLDSGDYQHNCISFMRKSDNIDESVFIFYRIGVPYKGMYEEIFNSQSTYYEGWNIGNTGAVEAVEEPMNGREYSITITLPPLGVIYLKRVDT